MLKRTVSFLFAVMLVFSLVSVSAFAGDLPLPNEALGNYGYDYSATQGGWGYSFSGTVQPPVITSTSGSVHGVSGSVPASLGVSAYSPQGGSVGYQWYSQGGYGAIPGATGAYYTPDTYFGSRGYYVGVYSIVDGMRSDEVLSEVMYVTYSGVNITSLPTKGIYKVGQNIDLKGLVANVYDSYGNFWTSYNGNGLSVYPSKLSSVGNVAIEISDGYSSDMFYVTVTAGDKADDPNHTHEFGEWEVTEEPTCVTTGTRTRKCECGETETEELLKTEHSWDEGTVTKEATNTNNGSRLYTCTVCKANRSEIIPAGTQDPRPTTSLDAAAAANPGGASTQGGTGSTSTYNNNAGNNTYSNFSYPSAVDDNNPYVQNAQGSVDGTQTADNTADGTQAGTVTKSKESSGWWLIPVSALVLVGTGVGAYYLMQKRGGAE